MSNGGVPGIGGTNLQGDSWAQTDTVTVRIGESNLFEVAERLGISAESLLEANPQIANPDQLNAGQELNVPSTKAVSKPADPVAPLPANQDAPSVPLESAPRSIIGERELQGAMMRANLDALVESNNPILQNMVQDAETDQVSAPLFTSNMAAPAPGGIVSTAMRMGALPFQLDAAKVPAKVRDELMAQLQKKSGSDLTKLLDQANAALASKDPVGGIKSLIMQGRVENYAASFESTYTVNGKEVKAAPHFRMTNGASGQPGRHHAEQVKSDLSTLLGKNMKLTPQMRAAIHSVAYGRATADQVKMVTDGLLKSGQFKVAQKMHPGLSDAETIRMMQWDHGVGIDCAGYVQQAFMGVHGGGRADFGFKTFGNENLSSLKGNPHFMQVKPLDIKPGDLIILDPPHRGEVGHTVLVRDHHVASADELKSFHDPGGFANPGDPVHVIQVDASWGAGQDGSLDGGVKSKVWLYNEKSGKWAEANPDGKGGYAVTASSRTGPYEHPMNGIFRPKISR